MRINKLFLLLVSFALIFSACGRKEDSVVLKINNTEVKESEYKLYYNESRVQFENVGGSTIWETDFGGKTADEVAKETALNGIKMIKTVNEKAKELNISLSEEEKNQTKEQSKTYFESYERLNGKDTGVTEEDVQKFLEEKNVFNKVYNNVTENFQLNEKDFDEYYNLSKEKLESDYTFYKLSSIKTDTKEKADSAFEELKNGGSFVDVLNKYETDEQAKNMEGKMEIYRGQLENGMGIVFKYGKGELSPVISGVDGFYVFKIDDVVHTSEDEIKSIAKNSYITSKKEQFFSSELEKWTKDAKVDINNDILKNISLNNSASK